MEEGRFATNPNILSEMISKMGPEMDWAVIDAVQKVPKLLNLVHKIIEDSGKKFALTGSSARELKVEEANLLAGRAFVNYLHPLTTAV